MKLSQLNPRWCPATSIGADVYQLIFTCPLHPGAEISVYFESSPRPQLPGIWKATYTLDPMPFESLTLTPSIGEPYHGRLRCTWHGNISNGEVLP